MPTTDNLSPGITTLHEMTPHPFRQTFKEFPHMELHVVDMGRHRRGATDGVKNIWINLKKLQVDRRVAQAHELIHLRRGDRGCQPETVEARVRFEAARFLLPPATHTYRIAEALIAYELDLHQAADHLWVTYPALLHRLDRRFIHPAEYATIERRVGEELTA